MNKTSQSKNWLVMAYDTNGNIISSWAIRDRTESQAEKEAEADVARLMEADDWTLVEDRGQGVNVRGRFSTLIP